MSFTITPATTFEAFNTIGDWTITGGTAQVVTNLSVNPTGLELTSGVGTNCIATKTISTQALKSAGGLSFWLWVPSTTPVTSIQIILSSDSAFASFFSKTFSQSGLHAGWNKLMLGKSEWGQGTGTNELWENTMVRLRVRVNAQASSTAVVTFAKMEYGREKPVIIISFDDSWDTAYTEGYTYMKRYGMPGVIFCVSSYIDQANRMTRAQHDEVYKAGWDICNHTYDHTDLSTLTASQQLTEFQDCENYLVAAGWTRNDMHKHVAYPFGAYNSDTLSQMGKLKALTGRTTMDRTQGHAIDDKYTIVRHSVINTDTLATAKGYVNTCISNGGMMELNFHQLVASPTVDTQVDPAVFQPLIDYINGLWKGGVIEVMSKTDWYRYLSENRRYLT